MSRGYPKDWNSRRKDVYQRDNYSCQNCGSKGGPYGSTELHAHHIVPKSRGGTHKMSNLKTMCKQCHNAIHGGGYAATPQDTTGGSTLAGHIVVFALTFWTFGLGNLIYAAMSPAKSANEDDYLELPSNKHTDESKNDIKSTNKTNEHQSEDTSKESYLRLGKRSGSKGFWQRQTDKTRNKRHGGCPECGVNSLTVTWARLETASKVKIIECEKCNSIYEEVKGENSNYYLSKVDDLSELNPTSSAAVSELSE